MSEPVPTEGEAGVEEPKFGEGCPICEFIEAGDCGELHKDWVKCREDSKKEGGDFVDDCHESEKQEQKGPGQGEVAKMWNACKRHVGMR
eukprot:gene26847-4450_t